MKRIATVLGLLLLAGTGSASELHFVDTPEALVPMPVDARLQPLPEPQEEEAPEPPRREVPRRRLVKVPSLSSYTEPRAVRYYSSGQLRPKGPPPAPPAAPAVEERGRALPLPLALLGAVAAGLGEPRRAGQPSGRLEPRERVSRDLRQRGLRRAPMRLHNGVASPAPRGRRPASVSEEAAPASEPGP